MEEEIKEGGAVLRWRLILGRFADRKMPLQGGEHRSFGPTSPDTEPGLDFQSKRLDRALEFLYGREDAPSPFKPRSAGLGESALTVPHWLNEVRELFPQEASETLQRDALERYHLKELLTDPQLLDKIEPDENLLKALLQMKGRMHGQALEAVRRIAQKVVEQIQEKMLREVYNILRGRIDRSRHTPVKVARNLDWRRTIRFNLKHYDPAAHQLFPEKIFFYSRSHKRRDWHVILLIDQSGSMLDSIIQSAVLAGIFAGIPALKTNFVLFDTAVVDLSGRVEDPVELLMSVHLGGGTNIAAALQYCAGLVNEPRKTVLVLVTDFFEGGNREKMISIAQNMVESGVIILGLAALSSQAVPVYDRDTAGLLVGVGVKVGAYTPQKLVEEILSLMGQR